MQTFLPYPSYARSLRVLDQARLGKQRVETFQILQVLTGQRVANSFHLDGRRRVDHPESEWVLEPSTKGWGNHPMTNMWRGHELSLLHYGLINCRVWTDEGRRDTCAAKMRFLFPDVTLPEVNSSAKPDWFGLDEFHTSHQANLVDKAKQYYLHHADKPHRPHGSGRRGCDGLSPHKPHPRSCDPKLMWRHYRPLFPDVPVSAGTADVAIPYVWPV